MDDIDNLDNLDSLDSLDALDDLDAGLGDATAEPGPPKPRAVMGENGAEEGPLETEAAEELSELLQGFKQRAKQEAERMGFSTQAAFWVTMVFQSNEQAMAFREALGLEEFRYLDGLEVAEKLGIPLPPADVRFTNVDRQDLRLIALTREDANRGKPDASMADLTDDLSLDFDE